MKTLVKLCCVGASLFACTSSEERRALMSEMDMIDASREANRIQENRATSLQNDGSLERSSETIQSFVDASAFSEHASFDAGGLVVSYGEIVSVVAINPIECQTRRVTAPLPAFDARTQAWQVCYTGGSEELDHVHRPERMVFTHHRWWDATTMDLLTVHAPAVTNPWVASILVVMRDHPRNHPLLNIRLEADRAPSQRAVRADFSGRYLELHGRVRAWEVMADGSKIPREMRLVSRQCLFEGVSYVDLEGYLVPTGTRCAPLFDFCVGKPFSCE